MGLPVTFTMTPGSSHWRQSFWVFTHTAWYLVSHIHAAPFNLQKNLKERVPRTVFMLFGIILNSDNDWKSSPGQLLHSLLMMPWGPQKSRHMTFSKILGLRLPALKIARIDGRMPRPKYSCPPRRVFIKSSSRVIRAFSPPIGRRFLTPVIGRPRLCVNDTKCHSAGKNGHDFRRKSPA